MNTVISATLFCEDGHYTGKYEPIKQATLRPDADGFAYWDVSTLLDAQLSFFVPRLGDTGLQACTTQGARYYVRYSLVNDYEQIQQPANTDTLNVIKGGLAYESLYTREFFQDKIITGKEPLRFDYPGEAAHPDEPLYVYFLDPIGNAGSQTIDAYISIRVQAGGFLPSLSRSTASGVASGKWQIWCIAIGYTQQNLASLLTAGQVADRLGLEVFRNGDGYLTKLVLINLDYRNYYKPRTLHYHNSLGGLDTQVVRGQIDIAGNFDKQTVTLLDTEAFASGRVLKAVAHNEDARETSSLKGETGWIPEQRADRLRDLLRSNAAWELVAGRLRPVSLMAKSTRIFANNDKLITIGLDWQGTYADNNYTPDTYMAPGTFCPGVDFLQVTQEKKRMPHVAWRIPEGYDMVELRWAATNAVPASTTSNTLFVFGSKGETDIDTTATWSLPTNTSTATTYFFARVVCDQATSSFGAWKTVGPFTLNTFPPPVAHSDFFSTYKGGTTRTVGRPTANDKGHGYGPLVLTTVAANGSFTYNNIGSAGGTFTISGGGTQTIDYLPPSSTFTGVDSIWLRVEERVSQIFTPAPVNVYSPPAWSRCYVKVEGGTAQVISLTGLPYIKITGYDPQFVVNSALYRGYTQKLKVEFFQDPLGQMPMDMTGKNLSFSINASYTRNGVTTPIFPSTSYVINSGNSMILDPTAAATILKGPDGNFWAQNTSTPLGWTVNNQGGDYAFTVVPSNTYVVL